MSTYSLTLIPYGKQPFTVGLLENARGLGAVERITDHTLTGTSIFSDLSYEINLNAEDIAAVQDVHVYINDVYEQSTYNNGSIRFPGRGTSDRKIFLDCYGFVTIGLSLIMLDGTEKHVTSEYLPVLVRKGQLNEAVEAMVNYVYNHQELLLLNGEPKPRNLTGLKESGYKSLAAQIILAEEIATIYESSYGYFKTNSRFRIEKIPVVDHFERLQYVTPATLAYIASHPEQLRPVSSEVGIRINGKIYHPQKTLSLQSVNSYDIYENRVVLQFVRKMVDEVMELQARCKQILQQIPHDEDYNDEYIYSSFFMFAETRRTLEKGVQQLSLLYDKFTKLWSMYQNALLIPTELVTRELLINAPRPTAIFMSVPQYNKVFVHIHQWFNFGIYDFEKERFMLSFIKISSLYESYLLTKMVAYFEERGYKLNDAKRCSYPVATSWKYKNTRYINTFCFTNGNTALTIFYQPVVFDTDRKWVNGVGLYRNNSISVYTGDDDNKSRGGHYYVPDYIIKVERDGISKYLIIDAKFSDVSNVRTHYVKDLAFKYLFSISPIEETDDIIGMCIIYGKCTDAEQRQSVYDNQLSNNIITPIAEILPLIEGVGTSEQYSKLDQLFKKLLG